MDRIRTYKYSEIFRSIQGEGHYCGVPTIWYRAWGCNFSCLGFSSPDPQNVKAEDLPFMKIPLDNIKHVTELPVFELGCDSSYSWSKRYSHLAESGTAEDIVNKFVDLLPSNSFYDHNSKQFWHLALTGGEPMISQTALIDILETIDDRETVEDLNFYGPSHITIETNGTQKLRDAFIEYFSYFGGELFWSCSPKLTASGEKWDDAIKPEILAAYNVISTEGQLKYVVDGTDQVWDEVEKATKLYRDVGIMWPVWIMPVGATKEEQEEVAGIIADQALDRGYNVSARVHCYLWSNVIGK